MGTAQMKRELKGYIESGDSRLLKILHSVAKEYTTEDFTKSGEPMTTIELKNRIRAAKSRIKSGQFTTQEDLENEMKSW